MADKRREFYDKLIAEEPNLSDADILATMKVYDSKNPSTEKSNHLLAAGTGVVKGAGDVTGVTPIVEAGKVAHEAAPDILANIKSGAQSLGKTITEFGKGAIESPMAKTITRVINPASMVGRAQELPTQADVDPAMQTVDPWEANARRATNIAGLIAGGRLLGGKKGPGKIGPVGDMVDTGSVTGTGAYPQRPALIKSVPTPTKLEVPVVPQQARTGSATPMSGMRTAAPVSVASPLGGSVTGPKVSMSVPAKAKPPVVAEPPAKAPVAPPEPPPKPVITPEDLAAGDELLGSREVEAQQTLLGKANEAAVAEQAAEVAAAGKTEAPGRKPAYEGFERRDPSRAQGEVVDRAYRDVRKESERKALVAEARKRLGATKPPAPPVTEPPAPLADATPVPEEGIAPPSSTVGLNEPIKPGKPGEVIRVGYDEPAKLESGTVPPKTGGPSPEVQARLDAGETREAIAADLRDKLGSKRAAKEMGLTPEEVKAASGGGPSKIPADAVEKIRAALGEKQAAGHSLTATEQALFDRIKSERGAADIKKLLMLGGGVAGGAIGMSLNDNGDPTSDQALIKTGLGILAGAALPAAIMSPHVGRHMLGLRTEGFLSGGAIPKNILTDAAAPVWASLEGTSTKGRTAPLKELARLPTNAKNFVSAMKNPASTNKYGKTAGPFSKMIGAIDTTARKMLERGGVPDNEIDRLLLTSDRQLFGGWKLPPRAQAIADIAYPFQRVPTALAAETLDSLGRLTGVTKGPNGVEFGKPGLFGGNEKMKTALDIGAAGGGVALGKWAKGDKENLYLAAIAMALLGPRAGIGTLGAMTQVGRQQIGGISPIPEQNADIQSFIGWPPTGWKALQKFGVVKGGQ